MECLYASFTPFREARMFEVDDIVKQGTTLGPILCSILTGEYSGIDRFLMEIQQLAHFLTYFHIKICVCVKPKNILIAFLMNTNRFGS